MKCMKDERYSIHGAHHYRLSARDLARFGMLYLQGGMWGDKRLLSENWIEESAAPYSIGARNDRGYAYMWWPWVKGRGKELGIYEASGYGGHRVVIIPKADIVLVHRADTDNNKHVPGPSIYRLFRFFLNANYDLLNLDKHPHPELVPLPL